MLTKGINRLLPESYQEQLTLSKFRFSKFKKFDTKSLLGDLHFTQMLLNFKTFRCNLKVRGLRAKLCVAFQKF